MPCSLTPQVKQHLQKWFNALVQGGARCGLLCIAPKPAQRSPLTARAWKEGNAEPCSAIAATGGPQGSPPGNEDFDTRAARVAELYAPDAILLATVSPRVRACTPSRAAVLLLGTMACLGALHCCCQRHVARGGVVDACWPAP